MKALTPLTHPLQFLCALVSKELLLVAELATSVESGIRANAVQLDPFPNKNKLAYSITVVFAILKPQSTGARVEASNKERGHVAKGFLATQGWLTSWTWLLTKCASNGTSIEREVWSTRSIE
jgi:hypothetical protein